jgi:hypothetical protein
MDYTLEQLGKELAGRPPGYGVAMDLKTFRVLFPLGEQSEQAREKAKEFAEEHGCTVHFEDHLHAIYFRKKESTGGEV